MRGMVGSTRALPRGSILARLKPEEAQDVLQHLIEAEPDLRGRAEEVAHSLLGEVSCEKIAGEVEDAVRGIDSDDVGGRAGKHSWGYVEPGEAATELLDEALEPYREDLKRRLEMGRDEQALEVCKGLVLGLYRGEQGEECEVLSVAPEALSEEAGWALSLWRGGGKDAEARRRRSGNRPPRRSFPKDWAEKFVPDWASWIARNRD
jgi:hypothetical protein